MDVLVRLTALTLASGLALCLLYVFLSLADGWASRAAIGKGAILALLGILIALPPELAVLHAAPMSVQGVGPAAIKAVLGASLPEEGGRLIVLLMLARMTMTDDPREFFIGVAAAGLAFGVIENQLYLQASKAPLVLGAVRGSMSAPLHLGCALLSGFGVWRYKREGASLAFVAVMTGGAVCLHGLFDFALMAWPPPHRGDADAPSFPLLLALGAGLIVAVLAQSLASLATIDAFMARIEDAPPHDAALARRAPLSGAWRIWGLALIGLAALGVLATLAAAVVAPDRAIPNVHLTLALAASLAVWGVGVRHLCARQSENAAAALSPRVVEWRRAA